MSDLSISYMGLALKNPLVASSSPLTEDIDNIRRMEDAGVAAVVLPSLFEEQLRLDSEALDADLSRGAEEFAEATSYLPNLSNYNAGPDGYLELIGTVAIELGVGAARQLGDLRKEPRSDTIIAFLEHEHR